MLAYAPGKPTPQCVIQAALSGPSLDPIWTLRPRPLGATTDRSLVLGQQLRPLRAALEPLISA